MSVSRSVIGTMFKPHLTYIQGFDVTLTWLESFLNSITSNRVAAMYLQPPSMPPLQVQYAETIDPLCG